MQPPTFEPEDLSYTNHKDATQSAPKRKIMLWIMIILSSTVVLLLLAATLYWYTTNQPVSNIDRTEVTIAPGDSVWNIAQTLTQAGVVRSEITLFLTLRYLVDPTQIKASTYVFTEPRSTTEVAQILIAGEYDNNLTRLTFVEGMRAQDYATIAATLPNITAAEFEELTTGLEGRLFPETYFVPIAISTQELVDLLYNSFLERTTPYESQIATQDLSLDQALILASIIEREANTPQSMRTVAGIFLNRLEIGMALQADASIEYVIDTPLGELAPGQLAEELRELDSPYNTYLYAGLPPTPIGNPGEDAISAIANPLESDYFYYITGNDGQFYYAETYDQHLNNIARHLRQ